LKQWQSHR